MRSIKKTVTFSGKFAEFCTQLVAEKRNLGFRYTTEEYLLKKFDDFSREYDNGNVLTKELALAWVQKNPNQSLKTQASKSVIVRQLGIFMVRNGCPAYILPENSCSRIQSHYTPHIFTLKELSAIFSEADKLKPDSHSPYRHLIIPLILRMLYGCGLRVSEAIHLRVRDVDLENGILRILDSKFGKDRLVPMDITLTERCRSYADRNHCILTADAFFFQNRDGEYFLRHNVYMAFREVLWKCRISHGGKGHGPRVHDFRNPNF